MYDEPSDQERITSDLVYYDHILRSNLSDYEAWHIRGHLLYKLKRYEEAIASYDKAIEAKPDYAASWYQRGLALVALGKFGAALSSYNESCQFNPNDYKAWLERGRVLYRLCRYGAARLSFYQATQHQPDSAAAWYWYSVAVEATGYCEKALSHLNQALELAPDSPYIVAALGRVLRKLGQYDAARATYAQALPPKNILERLAETQLFQEFRAIHHRSTFPPSFLFNPMQNLDISQFQCRTEELYYRTEKKCWFLSLGFDLYIFTNSEDLDRNALSLAQEVLLLLEELELRAIDYLEQFSCRTNAGTYGESCVVNLLCDFTVGNIQLELSFDTDPYGLWFVEFFKADSSSTGWQPLSFGRQTH